MDFDRLQLKAHLRLLYKHRKLIGLSVFAAILPLTIFLAFSRPQYASSISFEVADDALTRLLTSDIDVSPDLTVGNYMDILVSQSFARRVVRALRNEKVGAFDENAPSKSDGDAKPVSEIPLWKRWLGFTAPTLSREERAIIDLLEHMQTDHRGGQLIKVTVDSEDPHQAYITAKTIGEEFVALHLQTLENRIRVLNNYFQEQLDRTYARLLEAEERLVAFKRENKMVSAQRSTARLDSRLQTVESELIDLRSQRKLLEDRIAQLDEQMGNLKKNVPSLARIELQLPRIEELKGRLSELQSEYNTQSALYTERHPKIMGLRREIENTVNELRSLAGAQTGDAARDNTEAMVLWHDLYVEKLLVEVELNTIRTREEGLASLGEDYRQRILQDDADKAQELMKLERDVQVAQEAYQRMLHTNEKIHSLQAEQALNVEIVEPAELPLRPLPRKRGLKMAMGIFLGLLLGVGFAYLREAIDRSVKTIEDVEVKLRMPLFGFIVNHSSAKRKKKAEAAATGAGNLFLINEPNSDIAENFRTLRTNVGFALEDNTDRKIIMVTSPGPGEGKSTVAVNLAASFASYGQKTILLDTDVYRPTTHLVLGLEANYGLSNWLADETSPEEIPARIQLNGTAMDYIPAGTGRVTFQKLAVNSKIQELFAGLREQYDVILIDAPPVIPVSDPALLAPHVDMVMLVLTSGKTERDAAQLAYKLLKRAKCRYIGVVLNRLDMQKEYGPSNYFGSYRTPYREAMAGR